MSLIDEAIREELLDDEPEISIPPLEGPAPSARISDILPDMSFLLSETGSGSIEDYVDHPFNVHGSKGVARVLRGATGLLGNLNYAVIDIGLGVLEVVKEGNTKEVKHETPITE